VTSILGDIRLDLGNFDHLMSRRRGVIAREFPRALSAPLRANLDDFRDLLWRQQLAPVRLVPGLRAALAFATLALPTQRFAALVRSLKPAPRL
jgi:hypothetical protein